MHALVLTYGLRGIDAAQHAELSEQLAPALAAFPGLVSRTPLENAAAGRYGAVFVFDSRAAFERFVASELYAATYAHDGLGELTASDFSILQRGRDPQ